jgi:hypothetical protein
MYDEAGCLLLQQLLSGWACNDWGTCYVPVNEPTTYSIFSTDYYILVIATKLPEPQYQLHVLEVRIPGACQLA